jgi:hypothetical protein
MLLDVRIGRKKKKEQGGMLKKEGRKKNGLLTNLISIDKDLCVYIGWKERN